MKLSEMRTWLPDMSRGERRTFDANAYLRGMGIELKDIYQELEMDSRFADTHQDVSMAGGKVSLHSHVFYELICCRSSCGTEYLVGAERYRLQKGDIIAVTPGVSHCPLLPEALPEPYVRDVLWISTEFMDMVKRLLGESAPSLSQTGSLLRTAGTKWEYLSDLLHSGVLEAEGGQPGWEAAVVGNSITLLTHLARAFRDRHTPALKAERPELLDRAIAYMEDNLAQKITLEEVAHRLYVSESTISQTFRKKMGISFHQCLTQRRLIAAKALIQEGALLETVGQDVGFADYSTFYRAFRKEYGISPRQYRRLQEQTALPR